MDRQIGKFRISKIQNRARLALPVKLWELFKTNISLRHLVSISCPNFNKCTTESWGYLPFYLLNKGIVPKHFACFHDADDSSLEIHFPVFIYSTSCLFQFLFLWEMETTKQDTVIQCFKFPLVNFLNSSY